MPETGPTETGAILARVPEIAGRIDTHSLERYISELLAWNPRIGLVSKQNTANVLVRLISKSAALWDLLVDTAPEIVMREGLSVADIGSGGGFPGIIWRLLNPEITLTLVERKEKKAFFLETCASLLGIDTLRVVQKDARELARDPGMQEAFDLVVMMAVAPSGRLPEAVEALLRPGGLFLVPRGEGDAVFPGTIGGTLGIQSAEIVAGAPALIYRKPPA